MLTSAKNLAGYGLEKKPSLCENPPQKQKAALSPPLYQYIKYPTQMKMSSKLLTFQKPAGPEQKTRPIAQTTPGSPPKLSNSSLKSRKPRPYSNPSLLLRNLSFC